MSRRASKCELKHTALNPTGDDWRCPKCGAGTGDWVIDESLAFDCEKLHVDDHLACYKCEYGTSGGAFARRVMKAKNLIPCPHCAGRGVVQGEPTGKTTSTETTLAKSRKRP